jgi:hypothetical protein
MKTIWIKFGILFGIISIVWQGLMYYLINISIFSFTISFYILIFLIMIFSGLSHRSGNGNILSFGEAFRTTFFTGVFGTFISTVFTIVWVKYIDPDLVEVIVEKAVVSIQEMVNSLGTSDDNLTEAIEKIEQEMPKQFTFAGQVKAYLSGLIFIVVLASIASVFIRKEEKIV